MNKYLQAIGDEPDYINTNHIVSIRQIGDDYFITLSNDKHYEISKDDFKTLTAVKYTKKQLDENYADDVVFIIKRFNEITGKNYTTQPPAKAFITRITAQLKEGYSPEELLEVAEYKFKEWGDSPVMAKYVNPKTLFSGKFSAYLEELRGEATSATPGLPDIF